MNIGTFRLSSRLIPKSNYACTHSGYPQPIYFARTQPPPVSILFWLSRPEMEPVSDRILSSAFQQPIVTWKESDRAGTGHGLYHRSARAKNYACLFTSDLRFRFRINRCKYLG